MTNSYGSISFLVGNLYTWFFSGQFAALPLSLRAILCGVIITLYLLIFHRRPVAQPAQIPVTQMGMTVFPMPQPTTAPVTPPPGMTYVAPSPGPSYAPASTVITPEMKAINNWFFEQVPLPANGTSNNYKESGTRREFKTGDIGPHQTNIWNTGKVFIKIKRSFSIHCRMFFHI
jgi:hypothetical protein